MTNQVSEEFSNLNLEKLIRIYDENFKEDKEEFKDADYLKNYMYLVNNYRDLNKAFLNEKNAETTKNINTFVNLILNMVNNFKFPAEKVWAILYAYNLYKLYGFKVNNLTSADINLLVNLYMELDIRYSLSSLNKIMDFIFDTNLKNELYNMNLSLDKLTKFLLKPIDIYFNEGVYHGIPLNFFIKEEIKNKTENKVSIREPLKLNWDTPEDIYNHLKNKITSTANLMINFGDEEQKQEGYELISDLGMLVCKLKNMSEENYGICREAIKILMEDEKREPLDKYYLMFSLINQFTTYNSNKGMK